MTTGFGFINWIVLGVYLAAMLGIGALFARKNVSAKEYFFAGGNIPWWAAGVSMIATSVSATTFLGNPAETFSGDMSFMMLNFGVPVSILITSFVFIPYFRKAQVRSAYETLEKRFDRKTRYLAACIYSAHLLLRTGILIYGPAIVLSKITGFSTTTAILICGVSTIIYTYEGGFRAVIWTDVVQFGIFFAGAAAAIAFAASGISGGYAEASRMADEAGKFVWFRGGIDPSDARNFLSAGVAYIALDLAIRGCDQQFIQRYMSTSDIKRAQWATVLSAVLGLLVSWALFMVGAYLYSYYKVHPGDLPAGTDANGVFPHFILTVLPKGFSGLLVAAIFAAAMSSLTSAISALSNTTLVDFIETRRVFANETERLKTARRWVLLWGVVGVASALYASTFNASLLYTALYFTSLFTGSLLGIFLLAVAVPWARGGSAFAGAIIGMIALAACTRGLNLDIASAEATPVIGWIANGLRLNISWPWYPVISATATVAGGMAAGMIGGKGGSKQ